MAFRNQLVSELVAQSATAKITISAGSIIWDTIPTSQFAPASLIYDNTGTLTLSSSKTGITSPISSLKLDPLFNTLTGDTVVIQSKPNAGGSLVLSGPITTATLQGVNITLNCSTGGVLKLQSPAHRIESSPLAKTTIDLNETGYILSVSGTFGMLLSTAGGTFCHFRNTGGNAIIDSSVQSQIISRSAPGLLQSSTDIRCQNIANTAFIPILASAFTVASSAKWKQSITYPTDSLAKVSRLKAARWVDRETNVVRHGMIAEDLQVVFPELCVDTDIGLMIDISGTANLALALIGELNRKIDDIGNRR